jgi:O-succinylbenzoate synthase
MLRLESLTLREVRLALKEPFQLASGTVTHRRICLVQVRSDGLEGWGECVAGEQPIFAPETIDLAWVALREYVAPRVLGRELAGPEEVHPVLELNFRGNPMAKAAVETAVWDLAARREGVSLARKLGGVRDRIPAGISLGIQSSPEALVRQARNAIEQGYHRLKLKIKPGADVEPVRAVREALGPEAQLMVDANSDYTLADAEHLARLDDLGLMMIEQPLAWDDLLRHAELQRRLRTPICLDESLTSLDRLQDMIALGSGRIANLKSGRVGGHAVAIAMHDLCAAHGIPVWCGGMLESGVGRAHNVALSSLPSFTLPGDLSPSDRYWEKDIVIPEWTMDPEGWMKVPVDRPGLGVEVDLDRVEDLTVRREDLAAR